MPTLWRGSKNVKQSTSVPSCLTTWLIQCKGIAEITSLILLKVTIIDIASIRKTMFLRMTRRNAFAQLSDLAPRYAYELGGTAVCIFPAGSFPTNAYAWLAKFGQKNSNACRYCSIAAEFGVGTERGSGPCPCRIHTDLSFAGTRETRGGQSYPSKNKCKSYTKFILLSGPSKWKFRHLKRYRCPWLFYFPYSCASPGHAFANWFVHLFRRSVHTISPAVRYLFTA